LVRVLVAGAAGVIGMPLVRLLSAAGHEVVALTRSQTKLEQLRLTGAVPVSCDALDAAALASAVAAARPEVVVNQLTALPPRISPRRIGRDLAATNQLRTQGCHNLLAAAAATDVAHVVAQSVAFAYAPDSGPGLPNRDGLRQESAPLYCDAPGGFAAAVTAVAELERATLGCPGIGGAVLRYGFFYGPGTSYAADGSIAADVRRRRFPVIHPGSGTFSFIHVHDAALATLAVIEQRALGLFNIVDEEPAAVADWLPAYATMLGAPHPRQVPEWLGRLAGPYAMYVMTQMPGASNDHAEAVLGWRPLQPSWRGGFREDLARVG
jgi:nucleoside-diphosphate-sugar epimerase